jgi:photosystem II stability/assembly factor-like uncharacterized protein
MTEPAYYMLLAACMMMHTESGSAQWTRVCQPGADIFSLAVSGSTVTAVGSKGRIFSSTDSGVNWTDVSLVYWRRYPLLYKISVFREATFIGRGGCGVFRDGGGNSTINGTDDILAFGESRCATAVTFLAGGFGGGIRTSSDIGKTWISSNSGLSNLNVTSIASGPALPDASGQSIFAGTYGGGVFASTDNGLTWTSRSEGLAALQVNAMEVLGNRLYVAGSGGRVCASSDWGVSWGQIGTGLPDTEILSILVWADGLSEWIYAGTIDGGLWRCPAAGGTWSPRNTGLENLRVNAIVASGGALLIGTHEGIYRSVDNGLAWTRVMDGASPRLSAIHALPPSSTRDEDLIVSGTQAVYTTTTTSISSVFLSNGDGALWRTPDQFFNGSVRSIAHQNGQVFLLAAGTGDCGAGSGMMVSTDVGATWENRSGYYQGTVYCGAMFACMEITPARDKRRLDCYQGSTNGPSTGLFFSSDTGQSWIRASDKRPVAMGSVDSFLVVATYTGVYKSSDYWLTWIDITSRLAGSRVTEFCDDGDRLFACLEYRPDSSHFGGLLVTTDAGVTWLPAGLEGSEVVSLLPMDNCLLAVADGKIYAAFREELEWVDVTGNLAGKVMEKVTATSQFCYVLGADGKSIWKRSMAEVLAAIETPLPIQLASFTGIILNNTVQLKWSTLSEVNNYGFYVQRKLQSESAWTELTNSFIAGHGTTAGPQHYSFTDASAPDGAISYRLKQVDMDGSRHFSEPVQLSVVTSVRDQRPSTYALFQNYPNPFNPTTVVSLQLPIASMVRLIVYDMLGREVAVLVDEKKEPGTYEVRFDGSNLASGVYLYKMQAGPYMESKKLLIVR